MIIDLLLLTSRKWNWCCVIVVYLASKAAAAERQVRSTSEEEGYRRWCIQWRQGQEEGICTVAVWSWFLLAVVIVFTSLSIVFFDGWPTLINWLQCPMVRCRGGPTSHRYGLWQHAFSKKTTLLIICYFHTKIIHITYYCTLLLVAAKSCSILVKHVSAVYAK